MAQESNAVRTEHFGVRWSVVVAVLVVGCSALGWLGVALWRIDADSEAKAARVIKEIQEQREHTEQMRLQFNQQLQYTEALVEALERQTNGTAMNASVLSKGLGELVEQSGAMADAAKRGPETLGRIADDVDEIGLDLPDIIPESADVLDAIATTGRMQGEQTNAALAAAKESAGMFLDMPLPSGIGTLPPRIAIANIISANTATTHDVARQIGENTDLASDISAPVRDAVDGLIGGGGFSEALTTATAANMRDAFKRSVSNSSLPGPPTPWFDPGFSSPPIPSPTPAPTIPIDPGFGKGPRWDPRFEVPYPDPTPLPGNAFTTRLGRLPPIAPYTSAIIYSDTACMIGMRASVERDATILIDIYVAPCTSASVVRDGVAVASDQIRMESVIDKHWTRITVPCSTSRVVTSLIVQPLGEDGEPTAPPGVEECGALTRTNGMIGFMVGFTTKGVVPLTDDP